MRPTTIPELLRTGATGVALGRVVIGLSALIRPSVPARPWVGDSGTTAHVFGRALGGRDLALGLGALAALRQQARAPAQGTAQAPAQGTAQAQAWVVAGALSDTLDVVATVASWRELPPVGRWLVAGSAAGAAVAGLAGAAALRPSAAALRPSAAALRPS